MTHGSTRKRTRSKSLGYTTVELLVALGVFAIGITGVASMQKVTASSNRHAKALATATYVAESWQARLAIDGSRWTTSGPQTNTDLNQTSTAWLANLGIGTNAGKWTLPGYVTAENFGPNFGALGQVIDPSATNATAQTVFCTHVRVTPIVALGLGTGLLRVEVRVFWPREGATWAGGDDYCTAGANVTALGAAEQDFHFVYSASAIRPTPKDPE